MGVNRREKKQHLEEDAMADADTLFINAALRSINPNVHVVSELVNFSNMEYLNDIRTGQTGKRRSTKHQSPIMSPLFAAGDVYVPALNDVLSAQVLTCTRICFVRSSCILTLLSVLVTALSQSQARRLATKDHRGRGKGRKLYHFGYRRSLRPSL